MNNRLPGKLPDGAAIIKGCNTKQVMQADPNSRADTQVRPYGCIAHQKIGWVGADLCVCQVGLIFLVELRGIEPLTS